MGVNIKTCLKVVFVQSGEVKLFSNINYYTNLKQCLKIEIFNS